MKTIDSMPDVSRYVKEAADNDYAIEKLISGADELRSAFDRSRKRRVDPIGDKNFHRHLRNGLASLAEGSRALADGRDHPRRHWLRRIGILAGLAGLGAAGYAARNLLERL